jgi:hypothetical protein
MAALADNSRVRADQIVVEALDNRGDIVLRGTVNGIVQQAEALRTAKRVPGVRHVEARTRWRTSTADATAPRSMEPPAMTSVRMEPDATPVPSTA